MKMSFRWYGESDPISLEYISQIPGMHSIVSAVYDVKPGEVWPEESLAKMKAQCEAHGLVFDVVESIPVHEDIKLGRNNVDELLDVYCENIRRCAKYGVKCVTYNFMPVFDWTRTQLDKKAPDGSTSLVMYWDQMNGLDPLKDDIHLPGWDSSYSQEEVRELINAYGAIGEEGLWKNLEKFLKKVIPVAEECGVVMAIHPDDPPYPIFGLPRIITCEENLDRFLALVDSPANSLCLCTGSLGCAKSNDVAKMVRKYSAMGRIGFMHIRNVKIMDDGSFEERAHLSGCGSLDIYEIVKALVETGFDLVASASNHCYDWGNYGALEHSRELWNTKPVAFAGTATSQEEADDIPVVERAGITFAFLDYTYGLNGFERDEVPVYAVNFLDEERIRAQVSQARALADVVIVAVHWGTEKKMEPDEQQLAYAQVFADAGVDIVLGSHPHVIGPVEWVEGVDGHKTLVAYALGDFKSTHSTPHLESELSGMLACDFVREPAPDGAADAADGGVSIENVRWIPLVNHIENGAHAVYALKDYSDDAAARHMFLSTQDNPLQWMRETTERVVNSRGADIPIEM